MSDMELWQKVKHRHTKFSEQKFLNKPTKLVIGKFHFSSGPMFGSERIIVLPMHGDLNCPCESCTEYRFVERITKDGHYFLEKIDAEEVLV